MTCYLVGKFVICKRLLAGNYHQLMSDMRNGFIILIVLSVFLGGCIFLPPEGTPSNGHYSYHDVYGLEDTVRRLSGVYTLFFVNEDIGLAGGYSSFSLEERDIASKRQGSVSGASAYPRTSALRDFSHTLSHPPLKPV